MDTMKIWTSPRGAIFVDGVQVTEDGGWLDVASPMAVLERDGPISVLVRVRIERDENDSEFLTIAEVATPDGHLDTVESLFATEEGEAWRELAPAVDSEISSRVAVGAQISRGGRPSVRPPAISTGQAWDTAVVPKVGERNSAS
jgi:hypothetical protein